MDKKYSHRKYDEHLNCEIRTYLTRSQYDAFLLVLGTTGNASVFLRDYILTCISSSPNINPLTNKPDCLDNGDDV